jgi:hypothetical protein
MPSRTKSNIPHERLRWTVERAGVEFGLTTGTLRKMLNKDSAVPDADGLFSTQQVVAALHGSMDVEKLATQKALRRKLQLENEITEANVLNRSEVTRVFSAIADAIASRIMTSEMSRAAKEDLLKDISNIPVVLDGVAARQSRLPHRNGKHVEEAANTG